MSRTSSFARPITALAAEIDAAGLIQLPPAGDPDVALLRRLARIVARATTRYGCGGARGRASRGSFARG
jgi:hypothetical protein